MTTPRTGFHFTRYSDDPRPALLTDMSTIFVWGPSEDATPSVLPLNTPKAFNSSDQSFLTALGTGDLADAVALINAQLGDMQVAARLVVSRTAKGASSAETIFNMVGNQGAGTGLFAALSVGQRLGIIPRLFFPAGGYTGLFTRASVNPIVSRLAKFGGNTGAGLMTLADPAYGTGGSAPVAGVYKVRCKTAAANGGVFSVVDPNGTVLADATVGVAYNGPIKFTIADGGPDFIVGDGFDVTVTITGGQALANPICAALPQVLNALLAHAVVGGPGLTAQDADDWRETLSSDRLIPTDCWVQAAGASDGVYTDGAAAAVGLGVRCDFQSKGGKGVPSKSWAYQPVQGIVGLKRYDSFSLTDGATTGQELFSNNIGIIQRGEIGVETAAADSGFVFIGTDNAGSDDLWRFYNVTRVRDYTHIQLMRAWRNRLGKNNITLQGVQDVLNDMIAVLSALKTDGHIVGFDDPAFVADANSPEDIRAGRITMGFKSEEASPLLFIETQSRRDRNALVVLISDLASQASSALAA